MTTIMATVGDGDEKPLELKYTDSNHSYWLSGKRAKGVSTIAKIAADDYAIRLWHERMVAIGITLDDNLRENIAIHYENKDRMKDFCEDAKKVAKAHVKADRGSQMHHVLELVLLDQEHRLITAQQRQDAKVLKRTLDRYKLVPHQGLAEQFVCYPEFVVCGRFDAVLLQRADGTIVLVDLKSGVNAVKYPHATSAQLAMYAYAPHVSNNLVKEGNRSVVDDWRVMPETLDLHTGYVLLVEPGTTVGTLHEMNIAHGWYAAQRAMELVAWRKLYNWGDDITREAEPADGGPRNIDLIAAAQNAETLDELRDAWMAAREHGLLVADFRVAVDVRQRMLKEQTKIGA
jgi:PD-(D/E)XK nuclease superfamily